jgi:hypothetical protein
MHANPNCRDEFIRRGTDHPAADEMRRTVEVWLPDACIFGVHRRIRVV